MLEDTERSLGIPPLVPNEPTLYQMLPLCSRRAGFLADSSLPDHSLRGGMKMFLANTPQDK